MASVFPVTEEAALSIQQGSTFSFAFILLDVNEDPVDLFGFVAKMMIRRTLTDLYPIAMFLPAPPAVWNALLTYIPNDLVMASDGFMYMATPPPKLLPGQPNYPPNLNMDPVSSPNYWTRVALGSTSLVQTAGQVNLSMDRANTAILVFESALYDVDLVDSTETYTPVRGLVTLYKEVTR